MKSSVLGWLARAVLALAGFYIILLVILIGSEDRLVYPRGGVYTPEPGFTHDSARVKTADDVRLHVWYCPAAPAAVSSTQDTTRPVLFICHGNGGEITNWIPEAKAWQTAWNADVVLFDYRGYGMSEGSPSEEGLYLDVRAVYDWLVKTKNISPERIVLIGKSLGGAVATQLALRVPHRALVLENTFATLPDAAADHYGWFPVHWMMRNRFPTLERIKQYCGPVVILHAENDTLLNMAKHGQKLFEAANEPKLFLPQAGVGHNDLYSPHAYSQVRAFLDMHVADSNYLLARHASRPQDGKVSGGDSGEN